MDEFFDWCREQSVLPGSKLGTALEYSLKYETTFRTVLSDGDLVLSNNMAERAMKTLVMGRKIGCSPKVLREPSRQLSF